MPLADPRTRRTFRKEVDRIWLFGRSLVLGWRLIEGRVALLLLPNARLAEVEAMLPHLLERGDRYLPNAAFDVAAKRFVLDIVIVEQPVFVDDGPPTIAAINRALRRYCLWFTPRRAVALVDIVAFSRATRIRQAILLNSLAFSFAIAQRRCRQLGLPIETGRSTTGDGFYVWNRRPGAGAEADLFAFLLLALADNRLAVASPDFPAPRLRAAFTVGSHFSFFQPDGEGERERDFIVGGATIALARMLESAAPRQILLDASATGEGGPAALLAAVRERLVRFEGVPLLDGKVQSMRLRLTGGRDPGRVLAHDKHGFRHTAFNVRVDCALADGTRISLGARGGVVRAARAQSATVKPPST